MRFLSALILIFVAVPLSAQEREIRSANLAPELEWELLRMYDGGAVRYDGMAVIGASEVVRDGVAAMDGTLRIGGRVEGSVAMVNGDVVLEPGASVTGDITVIGGEVLKDDAAEVGGTITAYAMSSWGRDDDVDRDSRWRPPEDRGHARLTLRFGASYNRVEGLPVMFGPSLETPGANPLRLEALAIWRSQSGASLDSDRMGYRLRVEQFLGGYRQFSVGGSAYSEIGPLDRWQISDLEASLAAVLFHRDYRDHWEREGWSVFATFVPLLGVETRIEYRDEEHWTAVAGDPWSLFHGDDPWRLQPVMAQGDLQAVTGSVELDTRDDTDDPARGWFARLAVDRPVGGALTRPALPLDLGGDVVYDTLPAAEMDTDFTTAFLDVRRYLPVGYGSQVNFRLVAGGSLSEQAVPAQFQHALGGIGTLPGFVPFHADCGARGVTGLYAGDRYYTRYGCDRFVLGQVEYRGGLSLDLGFGDDDEWASYRDVHDWWDFNVDMEPEWVVFFDAGRGWAYGDGLPGGDQDTDTLFDAGFGFLLGDLGIYAAVPLNGGVERDPRFFIRLGRRF